MTLRPFLALLTLLTLVRVLWLAASPLPLYGDEAQYWTWAQQLDWGYYSKPPLLAWLIALTTAGGGDAEFWVRLGAPLAHGATAVAVYLVARRAFDQRTAFWSGIIYATLPAVFLSSTLISTDVLLLGFWAWGLYGLWRGLESGEWRWWLLCGASVGLALLAKYAAIAFWPSLFLVLILTPQWRHWLRRPHPYMAVFTSFIILAPNVVWNIRNGFVTFRHTRDNANLSQGVRLDIGELLEFLGGQFGVMGPILFPVLLALILGMFRQQPAHATPYDTAMRFFRHFTWPLLLIMSIQALLSRANANWAAAAFVAGTVLVAAFLVGRRQERWLVRSVALHSTVAALAFTLPLLPLDLPGRYDPFRRLKGADQLAAAIMRVEQRVPGTMILTDDRMLTALLLYYGRDGRLPGVVKWNGDGAVNDYYEMTTTVRQSDRYLLVTRDPPVSIAPWFQQAEQVTTLTIPTHRDRDLKYDVWLLKGLKNHAE